MICQEPFVWAKSAKINHLKLIKGVASWTVLDLFC